MAHIILRDSTDRNDGHQHGEGMIIPGVPRNFCVASPIHVSNRLGRTRLARRNHANSVFGRVTVVFLGWLMSQPQGVTTILLALLTGRYRLALVFAGSRFGG